MFSLYNVKSIHAKFVYVITFIFSNNQISIILDKSNTYARSIFGTY